jgi:hypothetical protein
MNNKLQNANIRKFMVLLGFLMFVCSLLLCSTEVNHSSFLLSIPFFHCFTNFYYVVFPIHIFKQPLKLLFWPCALTFLLHYLHISATFHFQSYACSLFIYCHFTASNETLFLWFCILTHYHTFKYYSTF